MEEKKENDAPEATTGDEAGDTATGMDPVRKWTLIVFGICVVLMAWYLVSDRITPFTSQARVHALVVPIASEVSGTVTDVHVTNNQEVRAGESLFQIERARYQFSVDTALANLQSARQATGVSAANIGAAEAAVQSAQASLVRAEQDAVRLQRIMDEDPGAISVRRLQQAVATRAMSQAQVESAQANLEKAREDLGVEGDQNVRVLEAQAALQQAEINLRRTAVLAPDDGVVTDVRVNRGNFASAGAPQMTFIATHNIWVQADFTENNLGHIKPGDEVEIVFDSLPGRIISGRIRSSGYGVAVDTAPLGGLPTVENNREWLRDAQRFPVVVDFELAGGDAREAIRIGAQASVVVYTGGNWLFNAIAAINIRINSILTYAF
jgi:multidrug resistance efflux pump